MPASEVKRDAHALELATSFFEDQDFQEECDLALKTNFGVMKGQALEGKPSVLFTESSLCVY